MKDDYEIYVSEEQEQDYNLLRELSDSILSAINDSRQNTIGVLLDEDTMISLKKETLKHYVQSRIYFDNQEILLKEKRHLYNEVSLLANKLFHDKTFIGNDSHYVMNGLAFYENSVTFGDVIIAFHNYRLDKNEENLWRLSLLLCQYIYKTLQKNTNYKRIYFEKDDSYDEIEKLTTYVIKFWEKNLIEYDNNNYELLDDVNIELYEKIDLDASYRFALEDENDEDKKKELESLYAAELVSRCSKSLYLLMETIDAINDASLYKKTKKIRTVINEICSNVYKDDKGVYQELANDKRLNTSKIELFEKNNELRLLKYNLKVALEKLKGNSIEFALHNRMKQLENIASLNSESLVEEFSKEFSKILMQKTADSLDKYYVRLQSELGTKYKKLTTDAVNALASAEYLYDMFVRNKAPEGFDYSGIAVLYFQAFETTFDTLLVAPYSKWLKEVHLDKLYEERYKLKKIKPKNRTPEEKKQYKEIESGIKQYFSEWFDIDFYYNNREKEFVTYLEIGKFHKFIDLRNTLNQESNSNGSGNKLITYLEQICFNKPINLEHLSRFVQAIGNAKDFRNKAAHGLETLKEEDVTKDKIIVYDETDFINVLDYKNLLYTFLDFFND